MIWAILGTMLGIILGLIINLTIPIAYIKYTAVIIISILDALFGAIKAELDHEENYSSTIFLTGLLLNTVLALVITLLGERLGLDLYLAVTVVFILRIFTNLGFIRRALLDMIKKHKRK